ncbi:CGNR zinc finger domain-containing protein [Actinomadura parmotrematis]|uniref:CGNR zinc finger domain-containing protein n=1 Tax=Actinomadura parmotrematis TaxID=2864039 RepID=A0ABS7FTW8_9ACTN|nr:CGNR zinc finger domain-containing protein [Actinomadura parmotrematis]MBW8483640.1 CGNR zinc finger domain-containing protein [Actinomadura parmotrematis]
MIESTAALLLRDFVNTLDVELGADDLAAPARLAEWLAGRGLVPPGTGADAADLDRAVALREGLRAAMLGHHGPAAAPPAELDGALAALPLRVSLAGGAPALLPAGTGASAGLARIAAAIPATVGEGTWPRLKACPEHTCMWAFLDTSKNRSRTWCSMRVCGNRTKTRAYRARHRPAPDGATP